MPADTTSLGGVATSLVDDDGRDPVLIKSRICRALSCASLGGIAGLRVDPVGAVDVEVISVLLQLVVAPFVLGASFSYVEDGFGALGRGGIRDPVGLAVDRGLFPDVVVWLAESVTKPLFRCRENTKSPTTFCIKQAYVTTFEKNFAFSRRQLPA